jgi:hypothetical protein
MIMATIETKALAFLESRHLGDGNVFYPTQRTEHGYFQVFEEKQSGTSEFASIQCHGDVEDTGRIIMYQKRDGIAALILFNTAARGIALSFRSNRDNHVDIFQQEGDDTKTLDEFSYAGTLSLRDNTSAGTYEFVNKITDYYCTVKRNESTILRFHMIAGAEVIGSFIIQPSCLDLSIRDVKQAGEASLLLGIAFSIWRLIPSEEGASTRSRHSDW